MQPEVKLLSTQHSQVDFNQTSVCNSVKSPGLHPWLKRLLILNWQDSMSRISRVHLKRFAGQVSGHSHESGEILLQLEDSRRKRETLVVQKSVKFPTDCSGTQFIYWLQTKHTQRNGHSQFSYISCVTDLNDWKWLKCTRTHPSTLLMLWSSLLERCWACDVRQHATLFPFRESLQGDPNPLTIASWHCNCMAS